MKIKYRILFIGISILFFSLGFSQEIKVDITKSEVFKDEYKESSIVFIEKDQNNQLNIVRSYKNSSLSLTEGFYIEHYDSNFKLLGELEYSMKHPIYQKYNLVLGVLSYDNNVKIIELYYDLKQKAYICQAHTISYDFKTEKKILFKVSEEVIEKYGGLDLESKLYSNNKFSFLNEIDGEFESDLNSGSTKNSNIVFNTNQDKSGIVIALDFKSTKGEYLKMFSFDKNLVKKIESQIETDNKTKNSYQSIKLSNDGNYIYLLNKNSSLKTDSAANYTYEVSKISKTDSQKIIIDLQKNHIPSMRLIQKEDDLYLMGFSSQLKENTFDGFAYSKISIDKFENNQIIHSPFTSQFVIDKYGKVKDKGIKNMKIKNVFFNAQKELYILAEEQYIMSNSTGMYGSAGNSTKIFGDISIFKLDKNGAILWARNINKKQSYYVGDSDISFLSFSSILNNNEVFIFINTAEKIKKIKNDRIEFGQTVKNNSNLNLIRVKEQGDFDFKEILDDEENEVPFMVSNAAILKESIFFMGRKGRKKQLLKITL